MLVIKDDRVGDVSSLSIFTHVPAIDGAEKVLLGERGSESVFSQAVDGGRWRQITDEIPFGIEHLSESSTDSCRGEGGEGRLGDVKRGREIVWLQLLRQLIAVEKKKKKSTSSLEVMNTVIIENCEYLINYYNLSC